MPSLDEIPKRIRYSFCNTAVQPPRNFDPKDIARSAQLPDKKLELDYVFGFRDDLSNTSLYATIEGELVLINYIYVSPTNHEMAFIITPFIYCMNSRCIILPQ